MAFSPDAQDNGLLAEESRSSLELLYHISRELASALDLRTVLQRVLFQSLKYVGGERGSIIVLDDNGKPIDAAIVYGARIHEHTTQQLRETLDRGLAGWVKRHRQPAFVPDTSRDERWLRRPDDDLTRSGAKSAMCVPLLARERLVGILTLVHPTPNTYTRHHFDLIQAIADQAGVAVLNARLYDESQRQARVMTALVSSAAAISATLQLEDVLQRILSETMQALMVETVALGLVDARWEVVFRAASGENADKVVGARVPSGQGVVGWVVHEGEGVVLPDVRHDSRFLPKAEQFEGIEVRALVCAPIFAQGRVIGVLEAINPRSGAFDPEALLVMTGIGNLAGSAIQNAQLFERLQAAHKRYRELFDDSVDPIFLTDWNGNILEANRQAAVLSEYTSRELRGKKIEHLHEVKRDELAFCPDKLKAGETCVYESTLQARSGRVIPVQVYVRRVLLEDSEAIQWILRDISERKALDSLREDLISMIYHDLRAPLTNIVSGLDMLSAMCTSPDKESLQSVLDVIRRSTERIQRLVNSLLDINRLEAGQKITQQQVIAPRDLAREAIEIVLPMIESRQQTLTNAIPARLPAVWVDVDMIRRVLINLLENASKFTPPEGKIEIGAKAKNGWVQFWVADNGPGIPPGEQERIFEKFARVKGAGRPGGLGIGLAFCRLAVQGHGGQIWVESTPGKGAKFILTLPVASPARPTGKG